MPSAWVQHVQSVYKAGKAKGMSYKQAMIAAKKSYRSKGKAKGGAAAAADEDEKSRRPWSFSLQSLLIGRVVIGAQSPLKSRENGIKSFLRFIPI